MVSALNSGAITLGSSSDWGHTVLGQDTLLLRYLSPPRCINWYWQIFFLWGNLVMD